MSKDFQTLLYLTSASLPAAAMRAMMTLSLLETVGLALLASVTWE